ncbi:TPA: DUF551 domain-containing protein [Escherichia coli]|nr:DUF551 domain-containing protein [Salmonella enterica subsp. enterica serovar Thompson]EIK7912023.1 DUF551 domain-containing protein [Escherichia coli]HAO7051643.1 DUF551 domain-containing protein [Escherichia coli]
MTTITRENAEIKSFITGFLSDPAHDNQSSNSLLANVFRIALASLEAEPVAYQYRLWDTEYDEWGEWEDCGECAFEGFVEEEKCLGAGVQTRKLYTAPPALVVPHEWRLSNAQAFIERYSPPSVEEAALFAWNACRAAMLQSQREGNPHVTPARLPGGFTIEDAKELHEDLVRSHISQALSGEKMKKNDRDADLRWIHGVIVQAAWFVKASLEQNALSGNSPVTPDGWISCSERMPKKNQNVLISVNFDSDLVEPLICSARYTGSTFRRGDATIKPGNGIEQATHWMPLPEPPQEVNQ